MLGHSSITITAETYTSLFPEAALAIAEAAARLVPRARPTAEPQPDKAVEPDPEIVPNGVDRLGEIPEIDSPSAHAPLTQTAPDEKSEAEQSPYPGEKPQVRAIARCAPGRIRTCDTRFRRAVLYPLSYEGGGLPKTLSETPVGNAGRSEANALVRLASGRCRVVSGGTLSQAGAQKVD
jgi:hypothetical protein